MGILSKLFGQVGVVRFEGSTVDGIKFSGKANFEVFNATIEEATAKLKNYIEVEQGIKVQSLRITQFYET